LQDLGKGREGQMKTMGPVSGRGPSIRPDVCSKRERNRCITRAERSSKGKTEHRIVHDLGKKSTTNQKKVAPRPERSRLQYLKKGSQTAGSSGKQKGRCSELVGRQRRGLLESTVERCTNQKNSSLATDGLGIQKDISAGAKGKSRPTTESSNVQKIRRQKEKERK